MDEDIIELSIIEDEDMSVAGAEDDAIADESMADDSIIEDEDDWASAPVASSATSAVPTRSCRVIIVDFLREAGPPKAVDCSTCRRRLRSMTRR